MKLVMKRTGQGVCFSGVDFVETNQMPVGMLLLLFSRMQPKGHFMNYGDGGQRLDWSGILST